MTARATWGAALLVVTVLLTGCRGGDDYCRAVEEHQAELTDVTASASPAALLDALPIFRDLEEKAPGDIRDEWQAFLDPLERLDRALRSAGVDPSTYDPERLPGSIAESKRRRIEDAAVALVDPAVVRAFDGVQQQAKDVCHTPLSL